MTLGVVLLERDRARAGQQLDHEHPDAADVREREDHRVAVGLRRARNARRRARAPATIVVSVWRRALRRRPSCPTSRTPSAAHRRRPAASAAWPGRPAGASGRRSARGSRGRPRRADRRPRRRLPGGGRTRASSAGDDHQLRPDLAQDEPELALAVDRQHRVLQRAEPARARRRARTTRAGSGAATTRATSASDARARRARPRPTPPRHGTPPNVSVRPDSSTVSSASGEAVRTRFDERPECHAVDGPGLASAFTGCFARAMTMNLDRVGFGVGARPGSRGDPRKTARSTRLADRCRSRGRRVHDRGQRRRARSSCTRRSPFAVVAPSPTRGPTRASVPGTSPSDRAVLGEQAPGVHRPVATGG